MNDAHFPRRQVASVRRYSLSTYNLHTAHQFSTFPPRALTPVSTLLNKPYDAFADVGDDLGDKAEGRKAPATSSGYIHIRIQQRNGRKTITTLQGTPKEYDPKKLLKAFKKEFACNGSIVDDEEMGEVIQLQGDQRLKIQGLLVEEGVKKDMIKIHGF